MFVSLDQHTRGEQGVDTVPAPPWKARWTDASPARICDARRAVAAHLDSAAPDDRYGERAVQDAQLIASELVTNAIRHAPGPCGLRLELSPDGTRLRITVQDGSRRLPVVLPLDGSRVGGHGLRLVTALGATLRVTRLATGKEVTAEVRLIAAGPRGARGEGVASAP